LALVFRSIVCGFLVRYDSIEPLLDGFRGEAPQLEREPSRRVRQARDRAGVEPDARGTGGNSKRVERCEALDPHPSAERPTRGATVVHLDGVRGAVVVDQGTRLHDDVGAQGLCDAMRASESGALGGGGTIFRT
jgi:hypothetical protein